MVVEVCQGEGCIMEQGNRYKIWHFVGWLVCVCNEGSLWSMFMEAH